MALMGVYFLGFPDLVVPFQGALATKTSQSFNLSVQASKVLAHLGLSQLEILVHLNPAPIWGNQP